LVKILTILYDKKWTVFRSTIIVILFFVAFSFYLHKKNNCFIYRRDKINQRFKQTYATCLYYPPRY